MLDQCKSDIFVLHMQATMDIISRFFNSESCDIHLNHGDLLDAIWSWIGIRVDHRQKVAEVWLVIGFTWSFLFIIVCMVCLTSPEKCFYIFFMKLLSLLGSLRPQSSERKSKWVVIRRQLRQVWSVWTSSLFECLRQYSHLIYFTFLFCFSELWDL